MKWVNVALTAGVLALGVVLIYLVSERNSLHAQMAQLHDRPALLQSSRQTATLRSSSAPPIPQTENGSETRHAQSGGLPRVGVLQELLSTKEGWAYEVQMARQALPTSFPDLERVLGLNPTEAEKFSTLLATQATERKMAYELARGNDSVVKPEVQRQLLSQRKPADEAEIAAMLGNKYSKWQEYLTTVPSRLQVRALQSSLGADSLSDSQIEPLVSALTAEAPYLGTYKQNPNRYNQLLDVAAPYLNARQLAAYRQMLEEQERRYLQRR